MENTNIDDDFERFCQIAQRSPRNSLAPIIHVTQHNSDSTSLEPDYLNTTYLDSLKRASSFREPRKRSSIYQSNYSGEVSATRSPIRLSQQWGTTKEFNHTGNSVRNVHNNKSVKHNSHLLNESNVLKPCDVQKYSQICDSSRETLDTNSPVFTRTGRDRPGSMKEISHKKSNTTHKNGSRPSAPTLHPSVYSMSQYSPSRHSVIQSEEQMLRVRRFERNKHGRLISKGDKDIPQIEIYSSRSPSGDSRVSFSNHKSIIGSNEQQSDVSSSDNEVIEIPAITTTLASPTKLGNHEIHRSYSKRASSPSGSLKPEARVRSKSWAVVSDNTNSYNQSEIKNDECEIIYDDQLLNIQVLGTARVGKTSMCMQFHTSESIEDPGDSTHDEEQTNPIRVEVNNLKASLIFCETDLNAEELEDGSASFILDTADAYLVVYAVDDRISFYAARKVIGFLLSHCKRSSAIILAANKSDLVRTRVVSVEEGKNLAQVYSCSFFEISTSINHRVDDLLVGIVVAINEQQLNVRRERDRLDRMLNHTRGSHGSRGLNYSPKHKSSSIKTPANNVIKFFKKHFTNSFKKNEMDLL